MTLTPAVVPYRLPDGAFQMRAVKGRNPDGTLDLERRWGIRPDPKRIATWDEYFAHVDERTPAL